MDATAIAHFRTKLAFETDPADVFRDQTDGTPFVLVDTRSDAAWEQGRAVGAVHMPTRAIPELAPTGIPLDTPVVVYCWSPGCNGGDKAALAFAGLGYAVRLMIGGFEYWAREGYPVENDDGPVAFAEDALVGLVGSPACAC
ncbi:rhodanese-like domain-containing protein [Microbacterium betulae]|uniref:Rhodanese-like domain-containing protein n=1 Tax=Microbacterium betulae TaxID=2981139 RepID=A0AA97FI23_9MICO|nr:rhodanese-like domain-containing protein [Microbacterium sp. AB]WOF22449.1 rhodanese-like domain-containing protein [Microbacterium sp. AB]